MTCLTPELFYELSGVTLAKREAQCYRSLVPFTAATKLLHKWTDLVDMLYDGISCSFSDGNPDPERDGVQEVALG